MNIPFVDLKSQYKALKSEIDVVIQKVIDEAAFIRGKYVLDFEAEYSKAYGVKHCISCANGTDAIYIALKMLGVGPGDEVVTTSLSWIATTETITQTGAKVVFVDIDKDTYNIDADKIEEKITANTKAIIPVHIYGQPCEMDKIKELCAKYGLFLIEDCAQAHFAEFKGRKVGLFGDVGTFSFYPGKNLGAYGDAGAIITNNDDLAEMMRMYANHGALVKHMHQMEGINSRLDGIQAAILSVKLPHIHKWNRLRYECAQKYNELLSDCPEVLTPRVAEDVSHVFHIYCVRVKNRDKLQTFLADKGIQTAIHYPAMLPFMDVYKYLGCEESNFPVASTYEDQILSLPIYPELKELQMKYIVDSIKEFYKAKRSYVR